MIRSAAKNHAYVAVATSPADLSEGFGRAQGDRRDNALALRKTLAARAFAPHCGL